MIDRMKKIMIACLDKDRPSAISALQALGTVHVVNLEEPASTELDELKRKQEQLAKVVNALGKVAAESDDADKSAEKVLEEGLNAIDMIREASEEFNAVLKQLTQLEPWGSFSKEKISELASRGIYVELCCAPQSRLPELPENCAMQIISQSNGQAYFAVVSKAPLKDVDLPTVQLPEVTNVAELKAQRLAAMRKKTAAEIALERIAKHNRGTLERYAQELQEKLDFVKARDGMATGKAIAYLGGYVPANKVDDLRQAARGNGWAIHYEDVADDDNEAPTNLIIPKPFRMAKWIFDFVGILPSYHETDVSISVLVFLSIFCGLLVGDAGYGAIFTAIVLYCRSKVKDAHNREGMNLLLVMSLCIFVYGALSGNWFALETERLPKIMRGLPWLSDAGLSQKHVQILCFIIGAFHMSMAHAWSAINACRAIDLQNDGVKPLLNKIREALGNIGWGVFLWGNYGLAKLLIVDGGGIESLPSFYRGLYMVGAVMILLFSVNWLNMGDVIYMPFTFINSFVDLLSYIRLFAVGLSGVYIASSFNGMAADLCKISPWMIPFGMLVVFLGHLLNVALAAMGVLVHGIRLNTLEFSGHIGISWGGKEYKPLRKQ